MTTVLLILCLALTVPAHGQHVDIPLNGLPGDYDPGCVPPDPGPASRTMTFTLPDTIESVGLLQFRVTGSGIGGAFISEHQVLGESVYDTLYVPADIRLMLTAPGLGQEWFFGLVGFNEPGVIEVIGTLNGGPNGWVDPDRLLGETITAEMFMSVDYCESAWIDPLVSLSDIHLVVEVVSVPTEGRCWGGVKALFR